MSITDSNLYVLLGRLRTHTEQALKEIKKAEPRIDGAINWGQLNCIETRSILTDTGLNYLEVVISEAAPDAIKLHTAVSAALMQRGWKDISIATEW